ncbi:MerR family transcriptional regulator [Pseudonocardia sp. C8]|uniref:chaperone modulator CbpM n=1 Tax=Pseudonocardia sp. C8 TaxID=2762759 RepID=UPI00164357E3|nr:chaperone modulator CbpM [Pseudonocardia sp. C8]MBC3192221.1 MerR family transcriptional regulator [Pseudonocardia sp. C8]
MTYPLVLGHVGAHRLDPESFAETAGVHPELVHRWATLGLVECVTDARGNRWFPVTELAAVARIQRLRAGLGLNYAALGVVVDLLDRIAELEATLQQRPRRTGG